MSASVLRKAILDLLALVSARESFVDDTSDKEQFLAIDHRIAVTAVLIGLDHLLPARHFRDKTVRYLGKTNLPGMWLMSFFRSDGTEGPGGFHIINTETWSRDMMVLADVAEGRAEDERRREDKRLAYVEQAKRIYPQYSGPDDDPWVAAELFRKTGLQPDVFLRLDPTARAPFIEQAIQPEGQPKESKVDRLAKALLLLKEHPEWTNERIASEVGVNPGTLSRWPEFRKAVEILAEDGKRTLPSGWKTTDGVEAVDQD